MSQQVLVRWEKADPSSGSYRYFELRVFTDVLGTLQLWRVWGGGARGVPAGEKRSLPGGSGEVQRVIRRTAASRHRGGFTEVRREGIAPSLLSSVIAERGAGPDRRGCSA